MRASPLHFLPPAARLEGLELKKAPMGGSTGFKGVHKNKGRYLAVRWENGVNRYLGIFATPDEAALCYARADQAAAAVAPGGFVLVEFDPTATARVALVAFVAVLVGVALFDTAAVTVLGAFVAVLVAFVAVGVAVLVAFLLDVQKTIEK
jgi:hypothetical protein